MKVEVRQVAIICDENVRRGIKIPTSASYASGATLKHVRVWIEKYCSCAFTYRYVRNPTVHEQDYRYPPSAYNTNRTQTAAVYVIRYKNVEVHKENSIR